MTNVDDHTQSQTGFFIVANDFKAVAAVLCLVACVFKIISLCYFRVSLQWMSMVLRCLLIATIASSFASLFESIAVNSFLLSADHEIADGYDEENDTVPVNSTCVTAYNTTCDPLCEAAGYISFHMTVLLCFSIGMSVVMVLRITTSKTLEEVIKYSKGKPEYLWRETHIYIFSSFIDTFPILILALTGTLDLWCQSRAVMMENLPTTFLVFALLPVCCLLLILLIFVLFEAVVVILMKHKLYGWLKEIFCHSGNKTSIQVDGKAVFKVVLLVIIIVILYGIQALVSVLYAFTDQKTVLLCVETVVIGMRGIAIFSSSTTEIRQIVKKIINFPQISTRNSVHNESTLNLPINGQLFQPEERQNLTPL